MGLDAPKQNAGSKPCGPAGHASGGRHGGCPEPFVPALPVRVKGVLREGAKLQSDTAFDTARGTAPREARKNDPGGPSNAYPNLVPGVGLEPEGPGASPAPETIEDGPTAHPQIHPKPAPSGATLWVRVPHQQPGRVAFPQT